MRAPIAAVIAGLTLLPTPALAAFDCVLQTYCAMATCESAGDVAVLIKQEGEVWIMDDGQGSPPLLGMAIAGGAEENEVTIVFAPEDQDPSQPISALLDIYPTGQLAFTIHSHATGGVMDMTGVPVSYTGLCAGEGG